MRYLGPSWIRIHPLHLPLGGIIFSISAGFGYATEVLSQHRLIFVVGVGNIGLTLGRSSMPICASPDALEGRPAIPAGNAGPWQGIDDFCLGDH